MIKITAKEVAQLINKSLPYTRLLLHREGVKMSDMNLQVLCPKCYFDIHQST